MIFIAHRGNIITKNQERENTFEYIMEAINLGFSVEIDIWWHRESFYLGHDKPLNHIASDFLKHPRLWCHAKNIEALPKLLALNSHCFFHDIDEITLTSANYIWTYPGRLLTNRSICVLPETTECDWKLAAGVCSDIVATLREQYQREK